MGWGAIAPVYRDTEYHAVAQDIVPLVREEGVLKGGGQTNDAKHREFLRPPPFNVLTLEEIYSRTLHHRVRHLFEFKMWLYQLSHFCYERRQFVKDYI